MKKYFVAVLFFIYVVPCVCATTYIMEITNDAEVDRILYANTTAMSTTTDPDNDETFYLKLEGTTVSGSTVYLASYGDSGSGPWTYLGALEQIGSSGNDIILVGSYTYYAISKEFVVRYELRVDTVTPSIVEGEQSRYYSFHSADFSITSTAVPTQIGADTGYVTN